MLRNSCCLFRHFVHSIEKNAIVRLPKTAAPCARCSSDSQKYQKEKDLKIESEAEDSDFFGIPSGFKLQQKRLRENEDVAVTTDIDEQYFGNYDQPSTSTRSSQDNSTVHGAHHSTRSSSSFMSGRFRDTGQFSENRNRNNNHLESRKQDGDSNIFDEQYFEGVIESHYEKSGHQTSPESISTSTSPPSHNSHLSFIDEQYFGEGVQQTGNDIQSLNDIYNRPLNNKAETDDSESYNDYNTNSNHSTHMSHASVTSRPLRRQVHSNELDQSPKLESGHQHKVKSISENYTSQSFKQNVNRRHVEKDVHEPMTAYDVAVRARQEIRKGGSKSDTPSDDEFSLKLGTISEKADAGGTERNHTKKRDSKGFHILSDQLQDLNKMTTSDIISMLRRKIIFNHEDFLAIDKPYGLASFDSNQDGQSLSKLLPRLCESLPPKYKVSDLHLVQGLDRDVTGTVILAKNEQTAHILKSMFDANEITQRFWAITKGVPNPRVGVVDIPVGEARVGNIYKMVLRPLYSQDLRFGRKTSKSPSTQAVTDFKVLASHQEAALVECQPLTKLARHQIRVHLSGGLNTPILGDHKYSHSSKMAPQRLNRSTLELLHIRQATVRHLALHLHCHTLVIPHYKSQRMIFMTARMPPHFSRNMKSLKLFVKGS